MELLSLPRKTGWTHQGHWPFVTRSSCFVPGASEILAIFHKSKVSASTFSYISLFIEASINEFVLPAHFYPFLIRHSKFTIILIPIGERKGDNIIPDIGNVELQAVWRKH